MGRNISMMTNFTLLGFSEHPELQIFLFVLCLGTYFMTLTWNLGLIVLIRMEPQLHSPMDLFVGNLSFVDISYTSSVTPKMLCDFFKDLKTISCVSCAAQFFFFIGWEALSAVSWQPWHMTGMLPSPTLCSTPASCPPPSVW